MLKKKEKAAIDAAVRAAARPATELVVEETFPHGFEFDPVSTHFGGAPYAEEGEVWPTRGKEKRPFDFVCQINLRDCPERPEAPFDLIAVFLCWEAVEDVDIEEACLVRSYVDPSPDKAIGLTRPPPIDEEDYRVVACSVTTERTLTYPWSGTSAPGIHEAAAAFKDPEEAYVASLKRIGAWAEFFSRVGGYPTWVHENTLEHDDLIFLVQIAHEPLANNCIQDAAPIYIAFSKSDPSRIETDTFQSF